MILNLMINLFVVFLLVMAVVIIKSLKTYKTAPLVLDNISESSKGVASVFHENSSKRVSECFKCAEESLVSANVHDFSIDSFFDLIRK